MKRGTPAVRGSAALLQWLDDAVHGALDDAVDRAARVAADNLEDRAQHHPDEDGHVAGPGCWRCGAHAVARVASGLCRGCVLYLAEVSDRDPRSAFSIDELRQQVALANAAVMADLRRRQAHERRPADSVR